jgi:LysM repeat protein
MDTISRENNSVLPIAGVILGVVALLIAGYSALGVSKLRTRLDTDQVEIDKVEDIASQASSASAAAAQASKDVASAVHQTQDAFTAVGTTIGNLQASIAKLEESQKRPAAHGTHGGPVVAGPDEYIIKSGDTGHKIARANGVSLSDLLAVNPDVDWKHLKVGQKIKLPAKK